MTITVISDGPEANSRRAEAASCPASMCSSLAESPSARDNFAYFAIQRPQNPQNLSRGHFDNDNEEIMVSGTNNSAS